MRLFEAGQDQEAMKALWPLMQAGNQEAWLLPGARHREHEELKAAEPHFPEWSARGRAEAMGLPGATTRSLHRNEEAARCRFRAGNARLYRCTLEVVPPAIGDNDLSSANFWLGCAAVASSSDAMASLVSLLLQEDLEGARLWWRRAADKGHSVAILNLHASFGSS